MSKKRKKKNWPKDIGSPERRHCVLCNKEVFRFEEGYVIGATGRVACKDCLKISSKVMESKKDSSDAPSPVKGVLSPQEILRELDRSIIGQEQAKRAIAIAVWKQLLRSEGNDTVPRTNLLLYGPTGCGKTALVREAAKIAGLPFINFDATTLTEAGYRGRDALDIIQDLMARFEEHPKLSCGIVFVDECDKLAARGGETRMEYSRGTQHSLLKLVEGTEVTQDDITLSTEKLLFIFGGAFSGLTAKPNSPQRKAIGFLRQEPMEVKSEHMLMVSDFVRYGMEPELMGRVGQCIPLEPLDAEAMKKILLESELSPLKKYQEFFRGYGIQLEFSNKRLDELVAGALERGSGARGLNSLVEEAVEPLLFKLASGEIQKRALVDGRRDRYAG